VVERGLGVPFGIGEVLDVDVLGEGWSAEEVCCFMLCRVSSCISRKCMRFSSRTQVRTVSEKKK